MSGRVRDLETELRDAKATIARLKKTGGTPSSSSVGTTMAPGTVSPSAGNFAPSAPASGVYPTSLGTPGQQAELPTPADALAPVAAAPAALQDSRTMKKLAEAEARYADLINQFQLAPEEKEFFKQLAARRSDIRREASTRLQDPTLTAAQRQAIYATAREQMDESDGSVRQFLNNDSDFSKFIDWEQTDVERGQMDVGRAIFDNNQAPLNGDQEAWLLGKLSSFRKDSNGMPDPFDLRSMSGTRVNDAYIRNVLGKYDRDTQVLMQDARSRFNPQQLESLAAFRKQLRVQTEVRLWNMARTMSGQ